MQPRYVIITRLDTTHSEQWYQCNDKPMHHYRLFCSKHLGVREEHVCVCVCLNVAIRIKWKSPCVVKSGVRTFFLLECDWNREFLRYRLGVKDLKSISELSSFLLAINTYWMRCAKSYFCLSLNCFSICNVPSTRRCKNKERKKRVGAIVHEAGKMCSILLLFSYQFAEAAQIFAFCPLSRTLYIYNIYIHIMCESVYFWMLWNSLTKRQKTDRSHCNGSFVFWMRCAAILNTKAIHRTYKS